MAYDSYYNDDRGTRDGRRRRPLLVLLDIVATLATLAAAVLMTIALIVPRIHPGHAWVLPMTGLVAPAIYVLTVLLLLYWVLRWRLNRAAAMLLFVLLGLGSVTLFWRPRVQRDYPVSSYGRSAIRCMSYNVRGLYGEDGRGAADRVAALIDSLDPAIVCLQEYNHGVAMRSEAFRKLLERYEAARFGLRNEVPPQAILSKYRVLRSGVVTEPRSSVWADLLVGDDTVHVVNNHLQSTGITALDNAYITGYEYLSDTAREEKLRSIAGRFRRNSVLRADQVDSIRTHLDAVPLRLRIVCGDFNDTPVSYTYRRMAEGLEDTFARCGNGYSHTFRGFFNLLRIDYFLTSEAFEVLSYEVPECDASDHLPLFVRIKKGSAFR